MPADAPGWPDPSPAHFLVVEDDPIIAQAVVRAASGLLPSRLAATGAQALVALAQRPLPRFVLLDFRLPDMDGLDVLRHLRANPECRLLPVIVFSSLTDRELIERTRAAGADDWVQKPDEPRALQEAVRELCRRWGGLPGGSTPGLAGNGSHAANGTGALAHAGTNGAAREAGAAEAQSGASVTAMTSTTHSTTTTTTTTPAGTTTTTTTVTTTVTSRSVGAAPAHPLPAGPVPDEAPVTRRVSAT